jgi:hypothetical protein
MDNETTNSDLLQEEHMNKLGRIEKLQQLIKDLESFAGQENESVRHNIIIGVSEIEEALWLLEDDL